MKSWTTSRIFLRLTVLSLCAAAGVRADSHTLQYRFLCNYQLPELPDLSVVGMLDDLQTEYYDSSLKRTESRQQWMTAGVPEVYWLEQTKVADTIQTHIFRKIAPFVTMFGIRYIQGVLGCTLENDQSTKIFIKININGFGDIECDMVTVHCWGTGVLTFLTAEFEDIIKDLTFIKLLNTSCVEGLYTTFRAGKTALQRKVAPQVLVFSLNSSAEMSTPLLCLITAFYPRAIDAMWLHNGVPVTDDLTVTVLPNHDATYRMEILIDIKNNDPSGYSCQVQHRSLSETLTVMSGVGRVSQRIWPGPALCLFTMLAMAVGAV
ncbi:hereditary hemochromatosis protein homolog [Chiloscyllium punctatum]|uniref:hereditary hemochromatosis protein homolog n=1 Tax=Chiloscyllium punctatum TaxID=137246 RepID=UPI003B640E94